MLATYAVAIEKHYGRGMDIEWGKDGESGDIHILQARPETVKSRAKDGIVRYRLLKAGKRLAEGRAIGQKIGMGPARVIADASQMSLVQRGDVLITDMTDPDWEPVMQKAAAIATRRGGRTCHAAIIARELGVPALVGCGNTLDNIKDGAPITVSCAEGDTGYVYEGEAEFAREDIATEAETGVLPVKLQLNVANPDMAFEFSRLPSDGVGLARLEFIINRGVGFHPRCALDYANLPPDIKARVAQMSAGYESPEDCYIGKIAEGAATIAAAFAPRPVIVRLSDFKSNEYAGLVGGALFEPPEENPMLGFRGAGRYVADSFRDCFALECRALLRVREQMALDNIWLMVPFVRTLAQADAVLALMAQNGIRREDWKIVMMCEVPSNVILADAFLDRFDGFSIGSNDLTQLTLALDRDSELVADAFDERDPAVKEMIARAISACRVRDKYVGICGQAPSDHPEFAGWLVEQGDVGFSRRRSVPYRSIRMLWQQRALVWRRTMPGSHPNPIAVFGSFALALWLVLATPLFALIALMIAPLPPKKRYAIIALWSAEPSFSPGCVFRYRVCAEYSIGSNDLTQLDFGTCRDSELVADAFDERDPAV